MALLGCNGSVMEAQFALIAAFRSSAYCRSRVRRVCWPLYSSSRLWDQCDVSTVDGIYEFRFLMCGKKKYVEPFHDIKIFCVVSVSSINAITSFSPYHPTGLYWYHHISVTCMF